MSTEKASLSRENGLKFPGKSLLARKVNKLYKKYKHVLDYEFTLSTQTEFEDKLKVIVDLRNQYKEAEDKKRKIALRKMLKEEVESLKNFLPGCSMNMMRSAVEDGFDKVVSQYISSEVIQKYSDDHRLLYKDSNKSTKFRPNVVAVLRDSRAVLMSEIPTLTGKGDKPDHIINQLTNFVHVGKMDIHGSTKYDVGIKRSLKPAIRLMRYEQGKTPHPINDAVRELLIHREQYIQLHNGKNDSAEKYADVRMRRTMSNNLKATIEKDIRNLRDIVSKTQPDYVEKIYKEIEDKASSRMSRKVEGRDFDYLTRKGITPAEYLNNVSVVFMDRKVELDDKTSLDKSMESVIDSATSNIDDSTVVEKIRDILVLRSQFIEIDKSNMLSKEQKIAREKNIRQSIKEAVKSLRGAISEVKKAGKAVKKARKDKGAKSLVTPEVGRVAKYLLTNKKPKKEKFVQSADLKAAVEKWEEKQALSNQDIRVLQEVRNAVDKSMHEVKLLKNFCKENNIRDEEKFITPFIVEQVGAENIVKLQEMKLTPAERKRIGLESGLKHVLDAIKISRNNRVGFFKEGTKEHKDVSLRSVNLKKIGDFIRSIKSRITKPVAPEKIDVIVRAWGQYHKLTEEQVATLKEVEEGIKAGVEMYNNVAEYEKEKGITHSEFLDGHMLWMWIKDEVGENNMRILEEMPFNLEELVQQRYGLELEVAKESIPAKAGMFKKNGKKQELPKAPPPVSLHTPDIEDKSPKK